MFSALWAVTRIDLFYFCKKVVSSQGHIMSSLRFTPMENAQSVVRVAITS